MENGVNLPIVKQVSVLRRILTMDSDLWHIIEDVSASELNNVYIGGGSIVKGSLKM